MATTEVDEAPLRPAPPVRSSRARHARPRRALDDSGGPAPDIPFASLGERAGWSAVAVLLIMGSMQVWGGLLDFPVLLATSLVLTLVGLGSLVAIWSGSRAAHLIPWLLTAGAVVAFVALVAVIIVHQSSYGTDEVAFDQYAAQLTLHGLNPYAHSMAPSLALYRVPDIFHTYLLGGGQVSRLSYPAGSFLPYLPTLALGMHMQAALVTDALFFIAGVLLAQRLVPRAMAWLLPAMLLINVYVGFNAGGVTDALFLPFLVLAVWRWDRYGDRLERGVARWVGPVALGLACTVKQTPWFLVPFLLVGVAVEASRRDVRPVVTAMRYGAVTLGAFAAVNLPFLVLAPRDWVRSVLTPFTSASEPSGQGLVGLTMFYRLGGQLRWYELAGAAAFALALAAYTGWYRHLKRVFVFAVPLALFWPARSFGSYFVMMLPAGMVAAATVIDSDFAGWRPGRWLAGAFAALGAGAAVAALTLAPALRLRVVGETSTGELQTVDYLTLAVRNTAATATVPHYAVTPTGQISSFWNVVSGPVVLAPHASATVTIEAPNIQSMPWIDGGFIVDAFTARPAQMATAPENLPSQRSTVLTPLDVNTPQPLSRVIDMTVQVTDLWGNPVQRAGVRVDLGQIVYAESGLQYGQASIDAHPEGQSPVEVLTDRDGVATFSVREIQAQGSPLFLQAWIDQPGRPPSAYSNIVSIQFDAVPASPR